MDDAPPEWPDLPGHGSVQMAGLISARFRAGMRPLALGTGLFVALSAPVADFLLEHNDLSHRANLYAGEVAGRIARVHAGVDPSAVLDTNTILKAVMGFRETRGTDEALKIEVLDTAGNTQAQSRSDNSKPWPLVWGEAPLQIADRPAGSVRVAVGETESIHRDLLLLSVSSALGLILGLALYLFPLRLIREEELVQLFARRSIKAAEEERLRLSRDLHDGIGQSLGAAAVALARVAAKMGRTPETNETARLIDAALNELRQVTQGLRPPSLDDLGIGPAVEALAREAERTGLAARIEIQHLPRMAPELEETCFRLAQEALSNIVHHARATKFRVSLARVAENVVLEVQDDGRGFSPASGLGLGLVGARERAAGVSGTLSIESSSGGGTRLKAVLPLRAAV